MDKEAVHRYIKVTVLFVTAETILTLIAIIQNHIYFTHHTCTEDRSGIILDSIVVCGSLLIFLVSILGTILAVKVRNKKILTLFIMCFFYSWVVFFIMDYFVYFIKNCPMH